MPENVVPLGARLRQRREELGLTQAQAARELEVARTAYRLWEMEAARPSPDRWRLIAKWLGVSVTGLLLAAELVDEQDALNAERAVTQAGLTADSWDELSNVSAGDFFSQERNTIDDQARLGNISRDQAVAMRGVLARVQQATTSDSFSAWHPGQFRKRFACSKLAPALSRAALATTAVGIPIDALKDAMLLISELVTNSVRHSRSESVDVEISLTPDHLRIAVSDQGTQSIRPRSPGIDGGWGLTVIAELATRWGIERRRNGKTVWIELDLQNTGP